MRFIWIKTKKFIENTPDFEFDETLYIEGFHLHQQLPITRSFTHSFTQPQKQQATKDINKKNNPLKEKMKRLMGITLQRLNLLLPREKTERKNVCGEISCGN